MKLRSLDVLGLILLGLILLGVATCGEPRPILPATRAAGDTVP